MVSQLCLKCGSTLNCQTLCLGARPRYKLVVDEDVKKPTKQTNLQCLRYLPFLYHFISLCEGIYSIPFLLSTLPGAYGFSSVSPSLQFSLTACLLFFFYSTSAPIICKGIIAGKGNFVTCNCVSITTEQKALAREGRHQAVAAYTLAVVLLNLVWLIISFTFTVYYAFVERLILEVRNN